ncbi:MAG: NUDIX domain-containing protein [Candidatus Paceibacterota bacterium]
MKKGIDYPGITVSYMCHDGNGNFLLNKRSSNCRDEHGCWDFGGGGLDFGDTVEGTLKKEIKEEYCVDPISYEFLGYFDLFREINGVNTHWLDLEFLVHVDREKVKNGEPHKFEELGWFTLDNLPSPAHSAQATLLEKFKNNLAKYYKKEN